MGAWPWEAFLKFFHQTQTQPPNENLISQNHATYSPRPINTIHNFLNNTTRSPLPPPPLSPRHTTSRRRPITNHTNHSLNNAIYSPRPINTTHSFLNNTTNSPPRRRRSKTRIRLYRSPPPPPPTFKLLAPHSKMQHYTGSPWAILFRHIHKTGGTSLRFFFSDIKQKLGYMMSNHIWCHNWTQHVYDTLLGKNEPRWIFEVHENTQEFYRDVLPFLPMRTPQIFTIVTLREPVAHAISFWLWCGKPRFGIYNRTMEYWMPHNPQTVFLAHGTFKNWENGDKFGAFKSRSTAQALAKAQRMVNESYDLVCVTEELDGCIDRIKRKMLFLDSKKWVPHISPSHNTIKGRAKNHTNARIEECDRKSVDCDRLFRDRLSLDKTLYDWARKRAISSEKSFTAYDRLLKLFATG